jgi:hypothetical protein
VYRFLIPRRSLRCRNSLETTVANDFIGARVSRTDSLHKSQLEYRDSNEFWPMSEAVDCNKYVFIAPRCAVEWSYQIYMEHFER